MTAGVVALAAAVVIAGVTVLVLTLVGANGDDDPPV